MSKVFAVQKQPNHDISHATHFGEIEVLVPFKDISFEAPDQSGEKLTIDATYVDEHLTALVEDEDLSRYIL